MNYLPIVFLGERKVTIRPFQSFNAPVIVINAIITTCRHNNHFIWKGLWKKKMKLLELLNKVITNITSWWWYMIFLVYQWFVWRPNILFVYSVFIDFFARSFSPGRNGHHTGLNGSQVTFLKEWSYYLIFFCIWTNILITWTNILSIGIVSCGDLSLSPDSDLQIVLFFKTGQPCDWSGLFILRSSKSL